MPKVLDVYRDWLQITEKARPLNHYQLLRLKQFEDDPGKVGEHYRKLNAHVRKFAAGEFAKESQLLLNELAKAMLCLTDAQRKREYDLTLGRADAGDSRARSMEELLLARKVVDSDQLAKARKFAAAIGVEVRDALVQQKLAPPEAVLPAYAESIGLPFLDLGGFEFDVPLLRRVPAVMVRQHSCAPLMIDGNQLLMAASGPLDPHVEEELRLRFGIPVRTVLCLPASMHDLITKHYSRESLEAEGVTATGGASTGGGKGPLSPETPEQKKERMMMGFMSFNFSFMLYQVALAVMGKNSWSMMFLGFPLAGSVGGAVLTYLKSKRK
jgi:hypothetical protein